MELCAFYRLLCRCWNRNQQTIITMKLLCILLIATFVKTEAGGFAQTIDLSVDHAPLESVFKTIRKQTGFRFVYTKEEIRTANPVSIHVKSAALNQVLELCFREQPLAYVIEDGYIIVKPNSDKKAKVIISENIIDITGTVTNEKGEAVAGVTVRIKGSGRATSTNNEGVFVLSGAEVGAVLQFSGTNVEDYELKISNNRNLQIRLQTKIGKLDEVQIIAYGTSTQRMNTGNVSRIGSAIIEGQPVTNLLAAIQGRAAGVFVTTQNGLPGGNITVQIRGRGSINSGTEPLYVIDGIPFQSTPLNNSYSALTTGITGSISPLNSINPSDIESIEILKDADATGIYGSRGANGVILITTKKGKAGKTKFDVNVYSGASVISQRPELLNLHEYLLIRREAFANDQVQPTFLNAPDLLQWDTTKSTDWVKSIVGGRAAVTNVQTSLSGGTSSIRFLFSGHYRNEGTILPGEERYQKGGINLSLQYNSKDQKFGADIKTSYTSDENKTLASSIFSLLFLPPNFPVFDSAGRYNWTGVQDVNPAAVLKRRANYENNSLLWNLNLRYELLPGLQFKTGFGYHQMQLNQTMIFPKATINPLNGSENYAYYSNNETRLFLTEPQLEYNRKKGRTSVQVLAGATWQTTMRQGNFITGKNYNNEQLLEYAGAAATVTASNQYSRYQYASVFGRMKYGYKEKYLIHFQVRRDGSSKFGPGKQYGNFGSVGGAWIFSKEKFLHKSKLLSYGKIRMSFGYTGNDQISDYQYLSTYRASSSLYQGVSILSPSRIANASFGWESNRKTEIGIETGFFSNRILITCSYFQNRSSNQLVEYPLPYMSGPFGYYIANLPAIIDNKGWEFDAEVEAVRSSKWSWTFQANLSLPRNELIDYPGLASSAYVYTYAIGEDINIRRGLHFTGINSQTGVPQFEDINKDGLISVPEDYVNMGKTSPSYYGGCGSEIKYREFEFSLFMQYSRQSVFGSVTVPGGLSNKYAEAMNWWQKPGDYSRISKATIISTSALSNLALSDALFYNGWYLRMKTVALSYRLKPTMLKQFHLEQVRFYMEGQNLFTLRKQVSLLDPETGFNGIAPMRTLIAGIQITL